MTAPTLKAPDSSVPFLREGYTFISSRCDRLNTDLFRTRIAGRAVVCMRGAEAAEIFYDGGRFSRAGALPPTTVRLLQDKGSVQTLDGDAHRHRMALFMSMMGHESLERLPQLFEQFWREREADWLASGRIVLEQEARTIPTQTACAWAGVPLSPAQVKPLAQDFGRMIDQAGSFGPATWYALLRRRSVEKWAREIIENVRSGGLPVSASSAVAAIARHRTAGDLLPVSTAAVELLNVLRPIVAVSRFIVFAAVALEEHGSWKERFGSGELSDLEPFAQEVRRFYPFFPVIAGTAAEEISWRGHYFDVGSSVMLDLYGTNHDQRSWTNPGRFSPERFRGWDNNPYTLVPQGTGIVDQSHRCPGERITVEFIKKAAHLLADGRSTVPFQDLTIDLAQMPAMPKTTVAGSSEMSAGSRRPGAVAAKMNAVSVPR